MIDDSLLELVRAYARLQTQLLLRLHSLQPSIAVSEPWDWPQKGEVEVDGAVWRYHRHGGGFLFRSPGDRLVDAHEFIRSSPFPFDAFRLERYERSAAEQDADDDHVGMRVKEIDLGLRRLCQQGRVVEDPRGTSRPLKSYFPRAVEEPDGTRDSREQAATSHPTLDDIAGFEYDWLATDAVGNVALFTTSGGGYAPDAFLENIDAHDNAIETIRRLPQTTQPRKAPQPDEGDNVWREVAERGLFSYDADTFGGPYVLESAPTEPVNVTTLPEDVAQVARSVNYPDLTFAALASIDKRLLANPSVTNK